MTKADNEIFYLELERRAKRKNPPRFYDMGLYVKIMAFLSFFLISKSFAIDEISIFLECPNCHKKLDIEIFTYDNVNLSIPKHLEPKPE